MDEVLERGKGSTDIRCSIVLSRRPTTSRDQSKLSIFSHDWSMLRVIINKTGLPKLKNAVRIWRGPVIQSVWSNSNRARHHSGTCRGSKIVHFWSISLHASSVRLIVTDVVQVVGSSGLACCLQGMSRTSSPNPESIRAKLDVVLSGVARDPQKTCWEGFLRVLKNLDYPVELFCASILIILEFGFILTFIYTWLLYI